MKLHEDKDAFGLLLENIHEKTGYRTDVLEKDYYVLLILQELSNFQADGLPAYFKGGTALYKALKTTNRFSEDIDLSVDTRGCSRTDPVTAFDTDDALQRFGKLKVEATSFTISEPVDSLEISAMLYNLATEEQKKILETVYDVKPFFIQTITLERIFVDKLFAAEAYVRHSSINQRAFEAAKHIYDLAVIAQHPKVSALLSDSDKLKHLLEIRMKEEQGRLDGIPGIVPTEFIFFTQAGDNSGVRKAYETMQNQYVLREQDRIEFKTAVKALINIQESLLKNPAWTDFHNTTI